MTHASEARIADLASRQHGLVTRTQLLGIGLTSRVVDGRVKAKRLWPVHRGVYQVGPVVPPHAREMAAVLACGPGAVVSHRSAAALWQLLPRGGESAPVEVTIPRRDRGRRPGIRAHRVPALEAADVAVVEGVPVTTPGRTLLDLAFAASSRDLEHAVARAERKQLTSRRELAELIERHPKRRGVRALRALLQDGTEPAMTRSEAEAILLSLTRKARLPRPKVNVTVGRHEVDFLWRRERLVVEVDGFAFHSSQIQFENDRRRDAELAAQGYQVIRVTWRQLVNEREVVLALLVRTLTRAEIRASDRA